jgi:hypothetical protein
MVFSCLAGKRVVAVRMMLRQIAPYAQIAARSRNRYSFLAVRLLYVTLTRRIQ